MIESYSSIQSSTKIYSTLTITEDCDDPAAVEIGCWIENNDSRKKCAELTREESVRILKLALLHLEKENP